MRRSRINRRSDERGVAIVLLALFLVAMIGIAAFAVDLGFDRQLTRHEQAATDAAALGGASYLPTSSADTTKLTNARNEAARLVAIDLGRDSSLSFGTPTCTGVSPNLVCTYTSGSTTVTIETPVTSVTFAGIQSYNLIRVRACQPASVFLSGVIGNRGDTICRESIARRRNITEGYSRGLIALDPDDCKALEFTGSSDTNLYSDGAVIVESSCRPNALDGGGSAWEVQAGLITVVGEYDINPCTESDCFNGTTPVEGVAPQGDPLASLPTPTAPTTAGTVVAGGVNPIAGGPACTNTYSPGRYDDTLLVNNNQVACFAPGMYYISNADGDNDKGFDTRGTAALYGTGVFIYLDQGSLRMNGSGAVVLEPVATSVASSNPLYPWRGITFFQSRTNTEGATINGNDASSVGTIYLPAAHLDFSGNASSIGEDFVTGAVIANTVTITGSGFLSINAEEPVQGNPAEPDLGLQR